MASTSRCAVVRRGVRSKVKSAKLLEVLNALEEEESSNDREEIFISPPENAAGDFTDEDSGDEDSRRGTHLPGSMLHATVVSEDSGTGEDNDDLDLQPAKKRQKTIVEPQRVWTKRDLRPDFGSWTASDPHIEFLKSQELSPVGLFELFFDEATINFIVNETNRYARQKNVNLGLTAQELKCVLGILILSGYISYPRRRMFWETSPDSHHHLVADAIRRDRFELIFSYLHFADNNELNESDRFAKVRPLIIRMNCNFQKHAPLEEFYSFGESMCEYFGHRGSKQLHTGKPIRLGYKIWCGTTSRGYLVWFEPSQGTLFTKPDKGLDLGGSMVIKFVDALQERGCLPYHIFFDKVFTSVKLMSILRKKGVKATGTVCEYRTERCPLKDPRELKKMKRGSFDYKVDESEEIIVCRWHDSNVVNICSNAVGIEPVRLTNRYSGAAKMRTQVHQPSLVRLYQEKVGGVGRMDQNIAKYKVKIRGMKWYSSFIGYIIDAALNNAWQLHRICCEDAQVDLLAFRRYVACVYLESNADASSQGRRSRRLETESRFDMIGHWIIHQDKRTRCALCHSQTNTRCEKCQKGVHAKCFREYHIR
ncbi:piggyBac transposable element-derived protein 2 [Loxodonta africana]|uniref:piggyBac transposable element-derived protein 2 n=1 Tax=Loxodonta africana TaxID=9785 RepID=UPI0000E3221D|nr:piggyBac transposable element-derived protein 2 [Loxodonta africana]XP_023408194.1 piggyBac transposable element-derived protein 2 [Loxodonta africana]XP_023408200.1 piggyBac transposable element-derived protein 2 [Loxodonta africana]XP_023408204.1 piggyBac transposable element-derived protein 2 [Loxodonta africana]XP_023408207.1 piggyBac transposable element-derived protein 2 [Loxodonta africana]XP_023408213.1 piggyBac transposable element-derived protein 2 [Loxodonta africana]XP_02340821